MGVEPRQRLAVDPDSADKTREERVSALPVPSRVPVPRHRCPPPYKCPVRPRSCLRPQVHAVPQAHPGGGPRHLRLTQPSSRTPGVVGSDLRLRSDVHSLQWPYYDPTCPGARRPAPGVCHPQSPLSPTHGARPTGSRSDGKDGLGRGPRTVPQPRPRGGCHVVASERTTHLSSSPSVRHGRGYKVRDGPGESAAGIRRGSAGGENLPPSRRREWDGTRTGRRQTPPAPQGSSCAFMDTQQGS